MGFRLPSALAGEDNEVEASAEGLQRVAELVGGTFLGAAIIGAGVWAYNQAKSSANVDAPSLGDLY